MNQSDYIKAMREIKATEGLKEKILSNAKQNVIKINPGNYVDEKHFRFQVKRIIAVSCVAATLIFSALAYTGVIDLSGIYRAVFRDDTGYIEQHMQPITSSNSIQLPDTAGAASNTGQADTATSKTTYTTQCTSNGIQMKLLSAVNDEKSLQLFVVATDITGNRLSGKTNFDYWSLDQGHGGNISVVDYDQSTKSAVLLITSLGYNQAGVANLQINGFSNGRKFYEGKAENKLNLYDLLQQQPSSAQSQDEVLVRGYASQSKAGEQVIKTTNLLGFNDMSVGFENIDWCTISNIGFVDGVLHIQTKIMIDNYYGAGSNDLASINLIDKDSNALFNGHLSVAYSNRYDEYNGSSYSVYKDMIYTDITTPEQLKGISVSIDYMEEGQSEEGNWQFVFEIPDKAAMDINVNKTLRINGNEVSVDTVSISPLGVSLKLPTKYVSDYQHADKASVVYQDGTVIPLDISTITGYNNDSVLTFEGKIIEIEKVKSVIINDTIIPVSAF